MWKGIGKSMKRNHPRERRANPRYLAQMKAHCYHVLSDGTAERAAVKVTGVWGPDGEKPQSKGMVRDISFGGVYLASIRPFREGTILVIELHVPRKKDKVVVIGLVRWVRPLKRDLPYKFGLGIQFIYMQKKDWEQLQRLFKEIKPTALNKG